MDPNVLIIMCDQLNAKALNLYGNSDVKTPNIDRLASSGITYKNHYVSAPMCVPSRVAFWTGMYPHATGIRHNQVLMPSDRIHYAKLLKDSGYDLALIGKDHCFQESDKKLFSKYVEFGHHGFEKSESDTEAYSVSKFLQDPSFNEPTYCATIPYSEEACSTNLIANETSEYLNEWNNSEKNPFCAWISFPDPHHPLAAPEPYASMYDPSEISLPPSKIEDLENKMERVRVFYKLMGFDKTSDVELRNALAMYYAMISFLDQGIGKILDTLESLKMMENTIIIFTADHGDYAGEHGMMLKSGTFYDCMTRVPLILSWKENIPKNKINEDLVSNIDIMPTIMDLIGIKVNHSVNGRALPTIYDSETRNAVFSEHGAGGPRVLNSNLSKYPDCNDPKNNIITQVMHARNAEGRPKMIRTKKWKYIYDPMDPVDELYDMEKDPWELDNLASDKAYLDICNKMRVRLLRWSILTEDSNSIPLFYDPDTLSDTPIGGPDFHYPDLEDN